jgi:hypothetical protein
MFNYTVAEIWDLLNTKFSLWGVITVFIVFLFVSRLLKRVGGFINFIASLPKPLLAGGCNVISAGVLGYSVPDLFSKEPFFSPKVNGCLICASVVLTLVSLKYERQPAKEEVKENKNV